MIPKLPSLTKEEAIWLHDNRHVEMAKKIVTAHNNVKKAPLDPVARVWWCNILFEWRQSEYHPSWKYKGS